MKNSFDWQLCSFYICERTADECNKIMCIEKVCAKKVYFAKYICKVYIYSE